MKRHVLSPAQYYKLIQYAKKEYKSSTLSNPLFAEKASQDLGFSVSAQHVDTAIKAVNIPTNKAPRGPSTGTFAPGENSYLAARVKTLETKMELVMKLYEELKGQ